MAVWNLPESLDSEQKKRLRRQLRDSGISPEDPKIAEIVANMLAGTVVVVAATTKARATTTKAHKEVAIPPVKAPRPTSGRTYPPVDPGELEALGLEHNPALELGYSFERRGGTAQQMVEKFIERWNHEPKCYRMMTNIVMLGFVQDVTGGAGLHG